jgi:hypothetical protein
MKLEIKVGDLLTLPQSRRLYGAYGSLPKI